MSDPYITGMTAAASLTGDELVEVSQLSTTVDIAATTISALASDNSYNDSGSGFVAAGFAVNDRVNVIGFTGNVANNIFAATITALTAGKMTIGGADGNVIVDDAAGELVSIIKWETHRATAQDIADLAAGGGDVVGPGSSTAGHAAVFDGATGKLLKDAGVVAFANGATIIPTATPATTEVGYLGAPILTGLDSGNVAPALTDCGKTFYHTDGNARNFTIPANGSVAFPVGTILAIENENGAAAVSIIITTDTLRWGSSTGTRTLAANGGCTIQKVASTVWRVRGEGLT